MATIQEVGSQIISKTPGHFYVFCGSEYGVKLRYLDMIAEVHKSVICADSVNDILKSMRTKRIVPLQPALYIIRYDEEFVSSLNEKTLSEINSTKICGTIVCIYEKESQYNKLVKYLPDYTVSIDKISPQFIEKYLTSDFPNMPLSVIQLAVNYASDYNAARNICSSMSMLDSKTLGRLSDEDMVDIFGGKDVSDDEQIKEAVASRNFNYLMNILSEYEGSADDVIYDILSTMIEMDKALDGKSSDFKKYANRWTRPDVYYMFMHAYSELKRMRSMSISNTDNIVTYLAALLGFSQIPSLEVLS